MFALRKIAMVRNAASNSLSISGRKQTAQDGSHFVMVVSARNTAQKKNVTIGIQTRTQVQILTGISPSDKVISVGSYALDPDTPVTVAAPTSDDAADGDK